MCDVPDLRFPEFTDEWGSITIKEACSEFQSGKNIKAEMITGQGLYPVYGGNGLRGFTESYNHDGDYILIGRQGALCGNIRKVTGKTYVTEHAIAVCASKENETTFLQYLFQKMKLGQYSDQSAQPGLAVNKLLRLNINVPSKIEQAKIAKILSLIDERIITQNKIIEKLQSLIKGIIVSHYSTTAHTIKVKIRELGEAYSTMVMSKEQLTNDGNLCVFYGELFTLYGCVIDKVKSRTSLEIVSSTLSHGRDLLFPASTTVDAVSLIAPSALMQKGIILGGDMFGIKVSEAYNPIYLSYYFNYIANKRLAKYAKGTTIIHLHYNEIANVAIELPNIEEQDKIVSTILEYSAKLSIEETILEKLFDLKQYLLKQLFI
ncbi:restriction endonuclease subunit S [Bacteroides sp. An269]|uniref:restriction endonuclease subunit S n=1 Tax=Bacteroides sp. An269 TaxID=1965613 RepID=UPI000B39D149|nr:restriction endonuclease subunit S [Bacteroides sp. An269]OUO83592.1 hypothetical protein B5F71_03090 [Bacteroides sp. An269]